LAFLKLAEDVAIAGGPQFLRYSPDVDCPGEAEDTNMYGWGIWTVDVPAPIPAVTKHGDPPTSMLAQGEHNPFASSSETRMEASSTTVTLDHPGMAPA